MDGYTCEWGPDGFLDNAPATLRLVDALGLAAQLQPSNDAARRRFIFSGGRLEEVPTSPAAFLKTRLLSTSGKLRLLAEPFGARPPQGDESIHDFAARRIGAEARLRLLETLVMAAGGSPSPPRREPLDRLAKKLADGTGLAAGVTLAGAWIRPAEGGGVIVSEAPHRKGAPPGPGPAWDRAKALLADPRLAALAV